VICSDLLSVPLSRAATASSAVPFALSPVTMNNYGGTCDYKTPKLLEVFSDRIALLIKATGIPIDHYSFEAVELLRDTEPRW
jgi:hypothetical protein